MCYPRDHGLTARLSQATLAAVASEDLEINSGATAGATGGDLTATVPTLAPQPEDRIAIGILPPCTPCRDKRVIHWPLMACQVDRTKWTTLNRRVSVHCIYLCPTHFRLLEGVVVNPAWVWNLCGHVYLRNLEG